jgi:hypothetical protein
MPRRWWRPCCIGGRRGTSSPAPSSMAPTCWTLKRPLSCVAFAWVAGTSLAAIKRSLAHPAGQAAGGKPKRLGHGIAGEPLLQAGLHGLLFLLRGESSPGLGGVVHQWTVWRSGRDPCRLVLRIGGSLAGIYYLHRKLNAEFHDHCSFGPKVLSKVVGL